MRLLGFFFKADKDDAASVEKILSDYADSIAEKEAAQFNARQWQAKIKRHVTIAGVLIWLALFVLYRLGIKLPVDNKVQTIVLGAAPVVIYGVRKALGALFARDQRRRDSTIKAIKARQKAELEKFKKRTKFDETRSLLEKFDEQSRLAPAIPMPATPQNSRSRSGTPKNSPGSIARTPAGHIPFNNRQGASPTANTTPSRPQGVNGPVPGSRGWVDRMADALIGGDEGGPQNRYALICGKCFSHNGLVLKEELALTQYVCPRCGHFNPPKDVPSLRNSPSSLLIDPLEISRKRTQSMHALSSLSTSASSPNLRSTDVNKLNPNTHTLTDKHSGKPRRYSAAPRSPLARAEQSSEDDEAYVSSHSQPRPLLEHDERQEDVLVSDEDEPAAMDVDSHDDGFVKPSALRRTIKLEQQDPPARGLSKHRSSSSLRQRQADLL